MNSKVQALISKVYDAQKSEEWLKLRGNMLTASDVASAIGVNGFESPEDLLYKKCGFRRLNQDTTAMDHGNRYEAEARDYYAEKYNETVHEIGLVPHPLYQWLGGSPDGVTESGKLIEIKCPLTRKITNKVPDYYIPQVQVLMDILDLDECDFIQYSPDPHTFVMTKVPRDREWFVKYLPIMSDLWQRVIERRKLPLCEIQNENGIFIK
jgi:putative phage-type endonuclease